MSDSYTCKSAVLFLVYNRPLQAERVFNEIRKVRPRRLYIAADGPRKHVQSDEDSTQLTRKIVTNIDWECEYFTLFQSVNLGCGKGVSTALEWFFSQEDEGIILEDDCLPSLSFFRLCDWALNTYREETKVWHIGGNTFCAPDTCYNGQPVSFVPLAQVWGWATWKNRWQHYRFNKFSILFYGLLCFPRWRLPLISKIKKLRHITHLFRGLDTWDYQWQVTVLNHRGYSVCPAQNYISNIGSSENATHTYKDYRANLPVSNTGDFSAIPPKLNPDLTRWFIQHMGL